MLTKKQVEEIGFFYSVSIISLLPIRTWSTPAIGVGLDEPGTFTEKRLRKLTSMLEMWNGTVQIK